jgi:hypothetical protein
MKTTKRIIQRSLPLNVKYDLISVSYLSLEDGGGCSCENCGKLITNIATVKSDKVYNIGLDCLETVLLNNELLNNESHIQYLWSDKPAISKAKSLRSKLLKKAKEDSGFIAIYREFNDGSFGFGFETACTRPWQIEAGIKTEPQGFDYSFQPQYKELTLNYIKGLTNVKNLPILSESV